MSSRAGCRGSWSAAQLRARPATKLGVGPRQVQRFRGACVADVASGLVSCRRGKGSARPLGDTRGERLALWRTVDDEREAGMRIAWICGSPGLSAWRPDWDARPASTLQRPGGASTRAANEVGALRLGAPGAFPLPAAPTPFFLAGASRRLASV
ncbi:MAG: hypothetical protein RL385_2289 [Pseudomonadota bacterium]